MVANKYEESIDEGRGQSVVAGLEKVDTDSTSDVTGNHERQGSMESEGG